MIPEGYELVYAPFDFDVDYFAMSHAQARQYFDWFIHEIPVRTDVLINLVGVDMAALDNPNETMTSVGRFLDVYVGTRQLTEAELEDQQARTTPVLRENVPTRILNDLSISLCVDTGMLFGHMLTTRHPHLRWDVKFKPKNDADYHRPILTGLRNGVDFSPVRIALVVGNKAVNGVAAERELPRGFAIWDEMA